MYNLALAQQKKRAPICVGINTPQTNYVRTLPLLVYYVLYFFKIRCLVPVWHNLKVEAVRFSESLLKWLMFDMHACAYGVPEGGIPLQHEIPDFGAF